MRGRQVAVGGWPDRRGVARLITEMDGSMLPVVNTAEQAAGETPEDRRKTRPWSWKEVRLCWAHEPGSVSPTLAATPGGVEEAGAQGRPGVIAAGAGSQTPIHALGDGASWITDPAQLQFVT